MAQQDVRGRTGRTAPTGSRRLPARRARRRSRPPVALLVPAAIAVLFLVGPFVALLVTAPWSRIGALIVSGPVLQALWLSLRTAAAATAL